MKKLLNKISEKAAEFLENPVKAGEMAVGFASIIALRIFVEFFLASKASSFEKIGIEYVHNFLFFAVTLVLIWLCLSFFVRTNPHKLSRIVLFGSWLILFPPILDMVKTGGDVYWSFYVFSDFQSFFPQFLTFFGRLPSGIYYFGSKIMMAAVTLVVPLIVFFTTRKILKSFLAAAFTYVILFLMGTFPSWLGYFFFWMDGTGLENIKDFKLAQFWGSPVKIFGVEYDYLTYSLAYRLNLVYFLVLAVLVWVLAFLANRKKLFALVKNSRIPQIIYHSGLFFIGMGLGFLAYPQNVTLDFFSFLGVLVLLISIWMAWMASVAINDVFDFNVDKISNSKRPLQSGIFSIDEYSGIGYLFFAFSLLGGLIVSLKFAAIFLAYQILAWFYSAEPFRLKKYPIIATFISAAASVLILFVGYVLVSGDDQIQNLPSRIIFLLLIGLTLSLPIKDFKDIEGDKMDGIRTIPVIFGEKTGRLLVAIGIFVSFILSVFFLNESRLFWWAALAGASGFLILNNNNIKPQNLFWWILGVVFIYGLILVKIVFL